MAALLIPATAFCQQNDSDPGARLQELQGRMHLTPQQSEQIRPILMDEAAKVRDIRAKHQGDTSRRGRRMQLRDLRSVQQDAQSRIRPILTRDQKAEWKKIRAERRGDLRTQLGK